MNLKQQRRDNRMNLQELRRNARQHKGVIAEIRAVESERPQPAADNWNGDGDYLQFMVLTAKTAEPVAEIPSNELDHWYDGEMDQLLEDLLNSETPITAGV